MSRAKKTKAKKQYSLDHRYRHITALLNHSKKTQTQNGKPTTPTKNKENT